MVGPHVTDLIEAGTVAIDAEATVETVADGMARAPDALRGDQGSGPRRARPRDPHPEPEEGRGERLGSSQLTSPEPSLRAVSQGQSLGHGRSGPGSRTGPGVSLPHEHHESTQRGTRLAHLADRQAGHGEEGEAGPCPVRSRARGGPTRARSSRCSRRSAAQSGSGVARAATTSPLSRAEPGCERLPARPRRARSVRARQAGGGGPARARARARRQARLERGALGPVPGGARGAGAERRLPQPLPGRGHLSPAQRARRAARRDAPPR